MLTYHRRPASVCWLSLDLAVRSLVDTSVTVYQKDANRYHLVMTEPAVVDAMATGLEGLGSAAQPSKLTNNPEWSGFSLPEGPPGGRLLWLEVSPNRATMTMQGNGTFSYRHLWERGVYGLSRYWLQSSGPGSHDRLRLRNFTRDLTVEGSPIPRSLRLEYELWSGQLRLGVYVLSIEIHP